MSKMYYGKKDSNQFMKVAQLWYPKYLAYIVGKDESKNYDGDGKSFKIDGMEDSEWIVTHNNGGKTYGRQNPPSLCIHETRKYVDGYMERRLWIEVADLLDDNPKFSYFESDPGDFDEFYEFGFDRIWNRTDETMEALGFSLPWLK